VEPAPFFAPLYNNRGDFAADVRITTPIFDGLNDRSRFHTLSFGGRISNRPLSTSLAAALALFGQLINDISVPAKQYVVVGSNDWSIDFKVGIELHSSAISNLGVPDGNIAVTVCSTKRSHLL
jgi:hypothetical protein